MARLSCDQLALDIRFSGYKGGWIQYEIGFLWEETPIFNEALLKRRHDQADTPGAFRAMEYERDQLIPSIERVLTTNAPNHWSPIEPDVTLALYPQLIFPFLKGKWRVVKESDAERQRQEAREQARQEQGGILSDDPITLIMLADSHAFAGTTEFQGQGIAQIMVPKRWQIEAFCQELKQEYEVLRGQERNKGQG